MAQLCSLRHERVRGGGGGGGGLRYGDDVIAYNFRSSVMPSGAGESFYRADPISIYFLSDYSSPVPPLAGC
jgi:hypothetical protein